MHNDDYFYFTKTHGQYEKTICLQGIKTVMENHRFEVTANPRAELNEQELVRMFRGWIKERRKALDALTGV